MKRLSLALAAIALAAIMTPNARAALQLRVYDGVYNGVGAGTVLATIVDGGAGDADGVVNGQILISNAGIGGLSVTTSLVNSNSSFAQPGIPLDTVNQQAVMTSNSARIVNNSGATVTQTIVITDDNYDLPSDIIFNPSAAGTFYNLNGSNVGNYINSAWYYAAAPVADPFQYASQTLVTSYNSTLINPNADTTAIDGFTTVLGSFPNPNGTFRMTQVFTVNLTAGTTIVSRGNSVTATAVPEPATMGAALFGLLGVAFMLRRKSA